MQNLYDDCEVNEFVLRRVYTLNDPASFSLMFRIYKIIQLFIPELDS